ncbi:hypothetical protein HPSAT_04025 [Helicobacter pylori Sat464]|nr:hypothetical protein HPSAT_04025 [Helicobacter pylori Sat464]
MPLTIEIPKRVLKILSFLPNAIVMTKNEKKYTLEDAKCLPLFLKDQFLEKRLLIFHVQGFLSFLKIPLDLTFLL